MPFICLFIYCGLLSSFLDKMLLYYNVVTLNLPLIRPGSLGVTTNLVFQNSSVLPNITSVVDQLQEAIDCSKVSFDIIGNSIYAGK